MACSAHAASAYNHGVSDLRTHNRSRFRPNKLQFIASVAEIFRGEHVCGVVAAVRDGVHQLMAGISGAADADGFLQYQRPMGKSGGHGVGWSEIPRYKFKVPAGWEETPVSIADLGGTEVRYSAPGAIIIPLTCTTAVTSHV